VGTAAGKEGTGPSSDDRMTGLSFREVLEGFPRGSRCEVVVRALIIRERIATLGSKI